MMDEHVIFLLLIDINLETGMLFFLYYINSYHFTSHNQSVGIFDIEVILLVIR